MILFILPVQPILLSEGKTVPHTMQAQFNVDKIWQNYVLEICSNLQGVRSVSHWREGTLLKRSASFHIPCNLVKVIRKALFCPN